MAIRRVSKKVSRKARARASTRKMAKRKVNRASTTPAKRRRSTQQNAQAKGADAKAARRGDALNIASAEEVKSAVEGLLSDNDSVSFLRKNISKWAPDVLNMLVTPKTDEYLAEQLGMKINAVRRILNLMQGYGVTNYYVAKNTNGWLSFAWYVNTDKVAPFFDYIKSVSSRKSIVTDECNDYFMCNGCYPKDRLIFTFDAAYEAGFKCNCGQKFARIDKDAAEKMSAEGNAATDDVGVPAGTL